MAYLVVGKCGTSGNPLHRCLLQVISPERLWLTWLLVNVAHLAIPCTSACFRLSVQKCYGLPGCWLMWHIWLSPAPLSASGYQSLKVMVYLVVGKCGTPGNPLHHCLLLVICPERLWLTWLLENVAHLAILCTAACFKLSVQKCYGFPGCWLMWHIWLSPAPLSASGYQSLKVMVYLVVGKSGSPGNPLHHCLLLVICPERLWLTWLLVNVAHLAILCTAACFSVQNGYGLPGC